MATAKSAAYSSQYHDIEAQRSWSDDDDNKLAREIRHGFIRKVYGIVCAQLGLTTCIALLFTFMDAARTWITKSPAAMVLLILSIVVAVAISIALVCSKELSKSYPTNYVLLGVFTGCMAFGVGGNCAAAATVAGGRVVLMALFATSVVTLGLTLFAFQTKYDFTSMMGFMFFIFLGFMVFGLIRLFFPHNKIMEMVYAGVGAIIFSIYIVIDTQLIIGSGRVKVDEEEYIFASITLYLDIINLFLTLLRLFTETRRD